MNQFGEKNLSPPRGPFCCVSMTNACPIHMRFHWPVWVMIIGICHEYGFNAVPDDIFMRYMPARFIF